MFELATVILFPLDFLGLVVESHAGNFFMRNSFDVEFGAIDAYKSINATLAYDSSSQLPKSNQNVDSSQPVTLGLAHVQVALLYTTMSGKRRIRVFNTAFHISSSAQLIFKNADLDVSLNTLFKLALDASLGDSLTTIRDKLVEKCVHPLAAYRALCAMGTPPGQLILPESFKLMPLYILSILKSKAMRNSLDVSVDMRSWWRTLVKGFGPGQTGRVLYPNVYSVGNVFFISYFRLKMLRFVHWRG